MKIIPVFLIFCLACQAQQKGKVGDIDTKKDTMETFDKDRFEKNKVDGEYTFPGKNNTVVRQVENKDDSEYLEEISSKETPYVVVHIYYMRSGSLKVLGEKFYSFPVGVWRYYNERGEETKHTDWDEKYKFSLSDLDRMMKGMKVEIMKRTKDVHVHRASIGTPLYIVEFPFDPPVPYTVNEYSIDGVTGKIIAKKTNIKKN